jgi:ATP-dependent RNA helicase RhlE
LQTEVVARALTAKLNLQVASVIGGVNLRSQTDALSTDPAIIIATPGRLIDHMQRRRDLLDEIGILVLDEADRLLDMGFLPDIRHILDSLSLDRQSLLFSATLSHEINVLAEETLLDPVQVQIGRRASTVATLEQYVYPVLSHAKLPLLLSLLKTDVAGGTLIFTRTKRSAERLAQILKVNEYKVELLHGDRSQGQRTAAMANFRAGRVRVMVATDLAARGIDILSIARVINFDVPAYPEDYVHRVGRTARAGSNGQAFTLASPQDEADLNKIEKLIGQPLLRRALPGFSDGREMFMANPTMPAITSARSFSPRRR